MLKAIAFSAFVAFLAWNSSAPMAGQLDARHAQIEAATR